MKKTMRKDEEDIKSLEDKKNTLFFRLVERYRNPKAEINQKPFRVAAQTDNLVQKYSVVKAKELNAEREQ